MCLQEINTARVCTRIPTSSSGGAYTADPSVPTPSANGTQAVGDFSTVYSPEQCSSSSRDIPWGLVDPDIRFGEIGWRATHSVGGIPFYVRGSTSSYPSATMISDRGLGIGARKEVTADQEDGEDGFGSMCTHPDLPPECVVDGDCHPAYRCHQIGHICVRKNTANCGSSDSNPCWCYMHDDCTAIDPNKMCSGTGRCVMPVIEVRNEMAAEPAEFRVYTSSCASSSSTGVGSSDLSNVDMYGASPWGRVDDVLHAHGLCSHRNWWEYSRLIGGTCSTADPNAWCDLETGQANQAWPFTKRQTGSDGSTLASQGVLKQEAHTCDRDYMHVRGMGSCHGDPGSTWWKSLDGTNPPVITPNFLNQNATYLKQSTLFRTYRAASGNSTSERIRIGIMEHTSDARFGFLGKRRTEPSRLYLTYPDWSFTKCSQIRTCNLQPFTLYGYEVSERRIRRVGVVPADTLAGVVRSPLDTYRCGPYGYLNQDSSTCVMDLGVVPLYRTMCYSQV